MSKIVAQSALTKKLGDRLKKAVESRRKDPTVVGGRSKLPDMTNAIGQITEMKIGTYGKGDNKGQMFFSAKATVIRPLKAKLPDGSFIVTEGMTTSFGPEPLCDTKRNKGVVTTLDDHIANVLNVFRLMGVDTGDMGADDIEPTCAAIAKQQPYFRFDVSTTPPTKEYPTPKTWENWGKTFDYDPAAADDSDDGVGDNTGDDGDVAGDDAVVGDDASAMDLDELLVGCNSDDDQVAGPAQDRLTELAAAAGYDQDAVDNSTNWEEVAQWVRDGGGSESESSEEDYAAMGREADGGDQNAADRLGIVRVTLAVSDDDFNSMSWTELGDHLASISAAEAIDYDALGSAAEEGDQEAADKLDELRKEAGVSDEDFSSMSWAELATTLGSQDVDADEAAEIEEAVGLSVGDPVRYRPTVKDVKSGKIGRAKLAQEYEIVTIDEAGDVVTLKSLETGKALMNPVTKKPISVKVSDLEAEAAE